MLWPCFEGNQCFIKYIAAYIELFPCGRAAGYKPQTQRCTRLSWWIQGMSFAQKRGFIPLERRPESHFIDAKDIHL
jgi:hypothetical protein